MRAGFPPQPEFAAAGGLCLSETFAAEKNPVAQLRLTFTSHSSR
jgi:hypothetical protein